MYGWCTGCEHGPFIKVTDTTYKHYNHDWDYFLWTGADAWEVITCSDSVKPEDLHCGGTLLCQECGESAWDVQFQPGEEAVRCSKCLEDKRIRSLANVGAGKAQPTLEYYALKLHQHGFSDEFISKMLGDIYFAVKEEFSLG